MIYSTRFFGSSTGWVTVVLPELFVWRLCHAWRHCIVNTDTYFQPFLGNSLHTYQQCYGNWEWNYSSVLFSGPWSSTQSLSTLWVLVAVCPPFLLSMEANPYLLIYSFITRGSRVAQTASVWPSCQHWAVRLAGDSRDAHRKQLSNGNKFYFSWITCSALWSFPRQLRGGMTDLFSVF